MSIRTRARRVLASRSGRVVAAGAAAVVLVAAGSGAAVALTAASPVPAASGASASASASPAAGPFVDTAGFPRGEDGIFTDTCKRTKTAADDPILMPGMAGRSMQHEFFGNTAVTASSTPASLTGGSTSCSTSADASAYWVPVLYQHGTALHPKRTLLYWRSPSRTAHAVQTIPAGLSIVAGNEGAMQPQGVRTVKWTCQGVDGGATASPHDCAAGHRLKLTISFPSCWDGRTLDGAKQTNVVQPDRPNTPCPASHPVQIPQIVFHAVYPTRSAADLTLSMGPTSTGPVTTAHADFMNGWTASTLAADVKACTAADVRCGPVTGADATPKGGKTEAQRKHAREGMRHHGEAARTA